MRHETTAGARHGSAHAPHAGPTRHAGKHGHHAAASAKPKRRRKRGTGLYRADDALTSHPTSRNAYVETREWLLEQHGPVCAYCGTRHAAQRITLDHVAPRRGQTAYDRRDNLVLACQSCNMKKRDLAPLAFLLGSRSRAVNLLRYGRHLSPGLLDLARSLVPNGGPQEDDDSPYRD